mgnify:CR=1 FL=1
MKKKFDLFRDIILEVADYIYTRTTLKPMSKTVFFLSRMLLIKKYQLDKYSYGDFVEKFNIYDDYDYWGVYSSLANEDLIYLNEKIDGLIESGGGDILGNLYNSLISGKIEAGEGLGSFLTPDEVVKPTVLLSNYIIKKYNICLDNKYIGDIAGGTGTFLLYFYQKNKNIKKDQLKLYDQSSLHLGFANINFLLHENISIDVNWTRDSLIDAKLTREAKQYGCLLTNPPFGSNTYKLINLDPDYKEIIGAKDNIDPAWLFLLRNLDLMCDRSLLGIILPNGIYQSRRFINLLKKYEENNSCRISIPYIFDFPVETFSLAGTVAKTGILFLIKGVDISETNHILVDGIGFVKKNGRKIKINNEYEKIINEIINNKYVNHYAYEWRNVDFLRFHKFEFSHNKQRISELCFRVKEYVKNLPKGNIHIPIDAVDDYGVIHFNQCLFDVLPKSNPVKCECGDIIVSCLNPRIWRVAKIPKIKDVEWSCSSEFVVLRSNSNNNTLFSLLSSCDVKDAAISLAKGTSSSRQRVNKDDFMNIMVKRDGYLNERNVVEYDELHKRLLDYIRPLLNIQ